MANLADDIEEFLKNLVRGGTIEVQRAMLASQFGCAPSQINYVLATRFTPERGYVVESRRGGGGYLRIIRLHLKGGSALHELVSQKVGLQLSQDEAMGYIAQLREQNLISEREAALMRAVIQRDTIGLDLPLRDVVRANLFKSMLLAIASIAR